MAATRKAAAVAHVRFEGRSLDVPLAALGVDPLAPDGEVKRAPWRGTSKCPRCACTTTSWTATRAAT